MIVRQRVPPPTARFSTFFRQETIPPLMRYAAVRFFVKGAVYRTLGQVVFICRVFVLRFR